MKKLNQFSKVFLAIAIMLTVTHSSVAHDFEVNGIFYNCLDNPEKTVEVTYRGYSSFDYSDEYTGRITIPSSVTYNDTTYVVNRIGFSAFNGCSDLSEVIIPNSTTEIHDRAFAGCVGLTSVKIPNSVTFIGSHVFSYCTSLTEVSIPNSVRTINSDAFCGCTGLTSVIMPNSVTEIRSYAFRDCTNLTLIAIPNSVTNIGYWTFYETGWYNKQPDGILYLDNCCLGYKGSAPVGELSLKDDTRLISEGAFSGCSDLTSITIPNSVTEIGGYVFFDCSKLETVVCLNPTPPACESLGIESNVTLYVPAGSRDKYSNHNAWGIFRNIKEIHQ